MGISASETEWRDPDAMDDIDPSKKLGPGWDHLFLKDTRTEEEKRAAKSKELTRR